MKRKWYHLSSAVLAALSQTLAADVLLEDSFHYPDGPVVGAPGSPWEAHSQAGNGPVLVQDGWLRLAFDRAEDVNAPLQGAPYDPAKDPPALYAGFTLRVMTLPTVTGTYFAHFRNSTTAHRARVWISRSEAAPDRFRVGIGNSAGASASTGPWPEDLVPGTDYRGVIRYDVASGLSTLWINPASESDPGVTATDTVGLISVSNFALRQGPDMGVIGLDDIRVGDAFMDAASVGVQLRVSRVGSDLELSWPASAEGYVPQACQDLMEAVWTDLPDSPLLQEGRFLYRISGQPDSQYYRLIKR